LEKQVERASFPVLSAARVERQGDGYLLIGAMLDCQQGYPGMDPGLT
jgi:hypothetical protein